MQVFDPIGRAMEYPLTCANGAALIVTGETLLDQAIKQRLNIEYGTLPATPTFGSRLNEILFEPIDDVAGELGITYILEALQQEGRISVIKIEYTFSGATVNFIITYRERASSEIRSMVYPFNRQV